MDDQVISKITTTESTVQRRARFGNRLLEETSDVFAHNAWDNVQWDEEQRQTAIDKVSLNSADRVEKQRVIELDERASHYWDTFYQTHQDKFFKDRQWLFIEFPEFLINCPDVRRRIALEASKDPHRHTHRPDADPLSCKCTGPQNPNYVDPNVQSDSTLPDMANASLRIWENGCGVGNTIISILETNR